MSAYVHKIDLDNYSKTSIRFYRNTEYVLLSSKPIFVSPNDSFSTLFPGVIGNGTDEVTYIVSPTAPDVELWISVDGKILTGSIETADRTLAVHMEDFIPPMISDEYPLFKTLVEYYFLYSGMEFNPSDMVHNLEKYAHIDETFDEFKEDIYKEVLADFPKDMAVNKDLLSKYILQFYASRGTEDSFRFLFRVLYNLEIDFTQQRKHYLIASDPIQGKLNDPSIVLQDNYFTMLFSYVIDIDVPFYEWKDIVYKMINPSGYLPFGRSTKKYETWTNKFADVSYTLEDRTYHPTMRYLGIPMAFNRELLSKIDGKEEFVEVNNFYVKALSS